MAKKEGNKLDAWEGKISNEGIRIQDELRRRTNKEIEQLYNRRRNTA